MHLPLMLPQPLRYTTRLPHDDVSNRVGLAALMMVIVAGRIEVRISSRM